MCFRSGRSAAVALLLWCTSVLSADADKVEGKLHIPRSIPRANIFRTSVGPNAVALQANSPAVYVWGEGRLRGLGAEQSWPPSD